MTVRLREQWDKYSFGMWIAFGLVMAIALGYVIATNQANSSILELDKRYRDQISALEAQHRVEVRYFRDRISEWKTIVEKQSDQLAALGVKSADTAKTLSEKDMPK